MITSIPSLINKETYWVPIDPQDADRIATSMRISGAWFRRRYLVFDRTTRQWGITMTGAEVKIRQARADALYTRKHGGPDLRSEDDRNADDDAFQFPADRPIRVH